MSNEANFFLLLIRAMGANLLFDIGLVCVSNRFLCHFVISKINNSYSRFKIIADIFFNNYVMKRISCKKTPTIFI